MIPEERDPKVHHMTQKAARKALAGRAISQESYAAVLRGELSLEAARELGRDRGPSGAPQPVSRISKNDRSHPCIACGETVVTGSRFHQGCDMKMFRVAREHLTEGRELTDEQREYLESSGKMQRVRARLAEEERKRQEKERRAAERGSEGTVVLPEDHNG